MKESSFPGIVELESAGDAVSFPLKLNAVISNFFLEQEQELSFLCAPEATRCEGEVDAHWRINEDGKPRRSWLWRYAKRELITETLCFLPTVTTTVIKGLVFWAWTFSQKFELSTSTPSWKQ